MENLSLSRNVWASARTEAERCRVTRRVLLGSVYKACSLPASCSGLIIPPGILKVSDVGQAQSWLVPLTVKLSGSEQNYVQTSSVLIHS